MPPIPSDKAARFLGVDALRGIAAMSVCFCHFIIGSPTFVPEGSLLKRVAIDAGTYGVQIFFVISGFVIVLSLSRLEYQLKAAPWYLLRRIARIDPPYLVSVLLALALERVLMTLPHYQGPALLRWYEVLGHVGYLNGVLGWHWAVSVYWSLAIEFQYYLGVTLTFPGIFARSKAVAIPVILIWSFAGILLPAETWLFRYGPLFATGFILCRYLERRSSRWEALGLGVINTWCLGYTFGWGSVVLALLTAGGIYAWKNPHRGWLFFGKISYSLYLVHALIGFHLVNGIVKFRLVGHSSLLSIWFVVAVAYAFTLPAAWLFWRCVEGPSHRFAQRLRPAAGPDRAVPPAAALPIAGA